MGGLIPRNKIILRSWVADLFGSSACSGAGIVFLDAQIAELEKKCRKMLKRSSCVNPRSEVDWQLQIEPPRETMMMEPTITQSSALYRAHHKLSRRRMAFFRKFRAAAANQPVDVRQRRFRILERLHQDNGR